MKKFRFVNYVLLTGAIGLLGSCNNFLNVNDNPNAVVVAPAANVLVAAETGLGFLAGSDLHRYTSLIAQQFAGNGGNVQTTAYDRGVITGGDVNNLFRGSIYAGALADMQRLVIDNQVKNPVYAGIAKIMQGYLFGITTDSFGDIPFSEALKFAANGSPVYDKSENVYKGVVKLIDSGIEDLKATGGLKPSADDLIYGGDLVKWAKFANTLKLRLYIHYLPKVTQNSSQDIADLLAKGPATFMGSVGDNFQLRFEPNAGKTNSIDQFERFRPNQFFPSATLVDIMNGKNDPRRPSYFTDYPLGSGTYLGIANGAGAAGVPSNNFSRMNTYIRGPRTGTGIQDYDGSAPIRMLTYAEHQLILAEYYARTGDLVSAKTAYDAGTTASMLMAGITGASVTAYITARPALTAANAVQQIIEEKFVANYGVAVEPWTDYRRTGFPVLGMPAGAQSTAILRVLPYSDQDRAANPANTPVRTDLTAKSVFWDR